MMICLKKRYFIFFQLEKLTSIEIREQAKFLQKTSAVDLERFFPNEFIYFKTHIKISK